MFCRPQFDNLSCPACHKHCAGTREFLKVKKVVCILTVVLHTAKHLYGVLTASKWGKEALNIPNGSPSAPCFRFLISERTGSGHTGESIQSITWVYVMGMIICYYVVVCGSKKNTVWRPGTLTIYCPVATIRTNRCNIQQFHVLPTKRTYVFCVDLRTNSDYFPIQHWLVSITEI